MNVWSLWKTAFLLGWFSRRAFVLHSSSCHHQIKDFCQVVPCWLWAWCLNHSFLPPLFSSWATFRAICVCKQDEIMEQVVVLFIKWPQKYTCHICCYWCFSYSLVRAEKKSWNILRSGHKGECYFLVLSASRPQITSLRSSQACCFQGRLPAWESLWEPWEVSLSWGKNLHFFMLTIVKSKPWFCFHQVWPGDPGNTLTGHFCISPAEARWNAWPYLPPPFIPWLRG